MSTSVSVIIPIRNGAQYLSSCLRALRKSDYKKIEIIVVDDHSTDHSTLIADQFQCTVVRCARGGGANYARNLGAQAASGEVLVFIDCDVVVQRDTITLIVEHLDEFEVDAVVGIYTAKHRHESFISQYKNLWVRYSYLKSPPEIDWMFGAISGIKQAAFREIGGFDVKLMAKHGNDDIELGKRLTLHDLSIMLSMEIEVEHLKRYSLSSFIKNQFNRSAGFAELALKLGDVARSFQRGFANVYPEFIISTIISFPLFVTLLLSAFDVIGPTPSYVGLALYGLVNVRFLNYLEQVRGLFAMIVMIPILFIDHLVCCIGSVAGVLRALSQ
ncbi:MAG: glycosyltransferase [bacterium]